MWISAAHTHIMLEFCNKILTKLFHNMLLLLGNICLLLLRNICLLLLRNICLLLLGNIRLIVVKTSANEANQSGFRVKSRPFIEFTAIHTALSLCFVQQNDSLALKLAALDNHYISSAPLPPHPQWWRDTILYVHQSDLLTPDDWMHS